MGSWLLAVAGGAASGLLSGLFGIGGGVVTTPIIRVLFGRPGLVAVGTPLAVIVPTAIVGAATHLRRGTADLRAGLIVGVAGMPLAVAGAWGSRLVGGPALMMATAVLLCWIAVGEVRGTVARDAKAPTDAEPPPVPAPASWPTLAAIGVLAGAYSGLLGLGGGFVIVPMLQRFAGSDIRRAVGTSLVAVAALAIPGTIAHAALGHIEWALATGLAAGSLPAAAIGARLASRASARSMRFGFAALLVVTAAVLAATELAHLRG